MPLHTVRCTSACLLVLAAAGCARPGPAPMVSPAPAASQPAPSASTAALEALYRARTDSQMQRFTPADVRFMTGMIGHHAQALIMAAMAPTHGASPSVHTLCARIINAQRDEIALMQRWLRNRGQPVPEVRLEGLMVMLMLPGGGMDHPMMPGMLDPAQMEALDGARGTEFDRQFLTGMIMHHQGAVNMVRELLAADGAAQDEQAFKLANDIQVDQTTEIARMTGMLAAITATAPGR